MGLLDDWQRYEGNRPNDNVPPLNEPFPYGKQPIRGVNVGGWLLVEPFITPSFFDNINKNNKKPEVIDEYTLSKELGPEKARKVLEEHYATYITEKDFKEIRDAGLDHVRIPFGYWAVYPIKGEPYVPQVSWRYLLRAVEYCRKYGLRVKIDLHAVPGGANGWNHSGRLYYLEWLNGPNGEENGKKALEVHDRLSKFFSQERYQNVVTMYGLVNEPRIDKLGAEPVLAWGEEAYNLIQKNGFKGKIVMGDGFRGLDAWKDDFRGLDSMVLDVHNYQIFNLGQIQMTHSKKIEFTCGAWKEQLIDTINNG
jgi:glucan 1,3-beta-glucosidase